MNVNATYRELKPHEDLKDLIHSYWSHTNSSGVSQSLVIIPDSFFKIVFIVSGSRIINYFMTGIWTDQKEFTIPANGIIYGCRLKILAPEYLIRHEIATFKDSLKQLDLSYMNLDQYDLLDFDTVVQQWEKAFLHIKSPKTILGNKMRLSQLLYEVKGNISASDVSNQIYWTNRQINRYLNKYLGISLKKYLNIQKCYESYLQIGEGRFSPEKSFFDQAHFIKEIKKHTGETPKKLFDQKNDRFIQLREIRKK